MVAVPPYLPRNPYRIYLGTTPWPNMPRRLTFSDGSETLSYEIIARGSVRMPRGFHPTEVRMQGRFLGAGRRHLPLVEAWTDPIALAQDLASWTRHAADQGARNLSITGMGVSLEVLPARFEWEPVGGFGDVAYELDLYEQRPLRVGTTAGGGTERPGGAAPGGDPKKPWKYRTVPGDTLAGLAHSRLGDGARWTEILELNRFVDGITDETLPAGVVLTMPPVQLPQRDPDPREPQ